MEPTVENLASPLPVPTAWQVLEKLASASLPPREFWSRFAIGLRDCVSAAVVLTVHRAAADQPWRVIASAVDGPAARKLSGEEFVKMAPDLADSLYRRAAFPRHLKMSDGRETLALAAAINSRREGEQAVVLALCAPSAQEAALDAQVRAAALIPSTWEARAAMERAEADSRNLTNVLDLVVVTNAEERFGAAALAFCNAVAAQYACDRVSLGWHTAGYVKIAAISRHEHVDRKMETPQHIETAMDECLDQDEEITWPAPAEATFVARDHERLAEEGRSGNVLTGYIKEVLVTSGDRVAAGQVLLRLNTEALKVEESAAAAELERYSREEEKARAASAVAEMQIAATLARQAAAKLEIVRFRLAQSEIKSRMDGVVIEGDLKERLDVPVKQGDPLFRVAELSGYFLDIQLDERDAHEVAPGAAGECAFLSDPEKSLPLTGQSVLPSAVEKDGVSVFAARAKIQTPEDPRWRPGMSGLAKINAGERSLLWILSHRTVDFLRLKLWW